MAKVPLENWLALFVTIVALFGIFMWLNSACVVPQDAGWPS